MGFTSFVQHMKELEPIPEIFLTYYSYLLDNFERKNCLLLRLLYISLISFGIMSHRSFNKLTSKLYSEN